MAVNWPERVAVFCRSPSRFLSCTTPDCFLADVLRELRDDRASDSVKVLLLSPLCEYPTLLCPSVSVGEETALELMSVFLQCTPKSSQLRCHLLLALASVLLCSSCVSTNSRASRDFTGLLLQITQDAGDLNAGTAQHSLRSTACECLRELEACCPGLLSQHLELLSALRQQETSRLHQAYTGLHTLALRNAVYLLAQQSGAGAAALKALLGGNETDTWEADPDSLKWRDAAVPSPLALGPMGRVPTLQTGADCKELRSLLSALLEESYLLSPPSQAALLHGLIEVVAMVPGVSPAVFRAQLLRLLGTSEVCLLHATLLMKAAFTDSLFSAEDEAFVLKRLVGLSQHPLVSKPEKLFYVDCLLHFPENRPIGCSDSDETLPVLLTPRLASALVPTVFNDSAGMLARLNLLSLVYLEEGGEDGEGEGGRGLAYLYDHLASLLAIVENRGSRETVVTFFRASFLFLTHFGHVERYAEGLTERLCALYLGQTRLAPHLVNLADRTQDGLEDPGWAVGLLGALQTAITTAPLARLTLQDLRCHLKILARVAEEGDIAQKSTLGFLFGVTTSSSFLLCADGDWRLGNGVLGVCGRLLLHPSLDALLAPLADLLQHLTCHYGDTDIQDHARLYYTLLTTLSREKLGGVLAQGGTEGGRQAKARSLSSIVAESEELTSTLTIQPTESAVFRLVALDACGAERVTASDGSSGRDELDVEVDPEPDRAEEPGLETSATEAYRAQFQSPSFASEITLLYQLRHGDVGDPRFDELFSIRLHFDLTDDHYEEVSDISVPCLFRQRAPPVVRLRLRPRRPYPTVLRAGAVFTTRDGFSWHTVLADVRVDFSQVFLPLPVPPAWGSESRLGAFEGLWTELCSGKCAERDLAERGLVERDLAERDLANCATSLFCCELEEAALGVLVEKHFRPYLIPDVSDEDEYKALFFLPPQCHVLLRISAGEDAVQFNIATDNWELLPYINSYLQTVTEPSQGAIVDS